MILQSVQIGTGNQLLTCRTEGMGEETLVRETCTGVTLKSIKKRVGLGINKLSFQMQAQYRQ